MDVEVTVICSENCWKRKCKALCNLYIYEQHKTTNNCYLIEKTKSQAYLTNSFNFGLCSRRLWSSTAGAERGTIRRRHDGEQRGDVCVQGVLHRRGRHTMSKGRDVDPISGLFT